MKAIKDWNLRNKVILLFVMLIGSLSVGAFGGALMLSAPVGFSLDFYLTSFAGMVILVVGFSGVFAILGILRNVGGMDESSL